LESPREFWGKKPVRPHKESPKKFLPGIIPQRKGIFGTSLLNREKCVNQRKQNGKQSCSKKEKYGLKA